MTSHVIQTYKTVGNRLYRVLVVRITSSQQLLKNGPDSIHKAIENEGLGASIGLYFYRFAELPAPQAFSKIGEVSREDGVIVRKRRGWLTPATYGDSYLKPSSTGVRKAIYTDALATTPENPMYFTYYEFDVEASFPKIDEIAAFQMHIGHFGRSTRNREAANTFARLGRKLVWYEPAFNEVLELRFPSGESYEETF